MSLLKSYTFERIDRHSCTVEAESEEEAMELAFNSPHRWSFDWSDPLYLLEVQTPAE